MVHSKDVQFVLIFCYFNYPRFRCWSVMTCFRSTRNYAKTKVQKINFVTKININLEEYSLSLKVRAGEGGREKRV